MLNFEKHNKILSEKKINTKKKLKKYYKYSLSDYYDSTLRDCVDLRNKQFFDESTGDTCISFSSQSHQCHFPFTDSAGIEKLVPADFLIHSFYQKNQIDKSFSNFLIKNVIHGVEFLHSKGLVHTDITLSNIFIGNEKNSVLKLGDFGEIKPVKSADKKEDIYRIGLIWIELLFPFRTFSERYHVLEKIKETNELPPEFVNLYEKESKIIELCLKKSKRITLKRILKMLSLTEKKD